MARTSYVRPSAVLLGMLLAGGCVGGERATGPDVAELALTIQPALIPSAADGSALPIHRIRAVAARQPDGAVLREQSLDVSPSAASWTLELAIPVGRESIDVVVHLDLLNVASDGTESVQFSGRTASLTVSSGARLANVEADIVRGPLSNLSVTSVTITSSPDTLYVGTTSTLSATVTSATSAPPLVFWTSLAPAVLDVADSVATGLSPGTAQVVASAGAHADTASVVVIVPAVDSVRVSPDSADVQVGQTRSYAAQLFDANGNLLTGRMITWTTASCACAIVDASGVVTGVAPGTTTVRATSEGVFDEAVVRVTAAPIGGGTGTNNWISGTGNWSVASNWSLGRIPAAGDTVRIEQGGGYTVTLDVDATVTALVIQGVGDPTTLDVGDHQLVVSGTGPGDEVYVRTLGRVTINNGAVRTIDAQNDGLVRATGALAIFEFTTLDNGGTIEVPSGGVLTVGGALGAQHLQSGTLAFQGGVLSVLSNTQIIYYGGSIEGVGTLIFAPDASLQLMTDLQLDGPAVLLNGASISGSDSQTLTIGTGGTLYTQSDAAPVVVNADIQLLGTLIATGSDTRIGALQVGPAANVYLGSSDASVVLVTGDVLNAGAIVAAGVGATFGPGAGGEIVNEPSGSITVSGGGGSFELNGQLENSGSIVVASPLRLENYDDQLQRVTVHHVNTSTGTIDIYAGAELDVRLGGSSPSFTNEGQIDLLGTTSSFQVLDSASPTGSVTNGDTGTWSGHGSVVLSPGLELTNRGTLSPGLSPGTLTWTGGIAMWPAGRLNIEIEGVTPATGHDQLLSTGDLVLDVNGVPNGILEVTTPGPFVPSDGDRFAILTFQSRSGTFAAVNFPVIDGVTLDTLWAESEGIDTLYVVASGTGGAAPVNRWTNAVDGNWSEPSNWSRNAVPVAGDSVVIDVDGTYTVTVDVAATMGALVLGAPTGLQTLSASARTLTLGGPAYVGPNGMLDLDGANVTGSGTMTNAGGGVIWNSAIGVAWSNQSILQLRGVNTVSGSVTTTAGSLLRIEGDLCCAATTTFATGFTNNGYIELTSIGGASDAALVVNAGTLTNASGATIEASVGVGGARILAATLDNQGTLLVGQTMSFISGDGGSNSGIVDVEGGDLTFSQTGVFINTGTVTIAAGRTWTVFNGNLYQLAGLIEGPGMLFLNNTQLQLATPFSTAVAGLTATTSNIFGTGTLTNATGSTLVVQGGSIAVPIVNEGLLRLRGSPTLHEALTTTPSSTIRIEGDATTGGASMTFVNGFTNNGLLEMTAINGSSDAAMQVNVGAWTNAAGGTFTVTGNGPRTMNAAFVNEGTFVVDATLDMNGSFTHSDGAVLSGSGILEASALPALILDGDVSPGSSPGVLSIMSPAAGITQSEVSGLNVELNGTVAGTGYDQLAVSGPVTLSGASLVALDTTAFNPSVGDTFAVMTFAQRVGNFASVTLPVVDGVTLDTVWAEAGTADTLFIVASAIGAPAPVNRWQAAVSGNWSEGLNWSQGTAPDAADSVVIDVDGNYVVVLDEDATVRNLTLGGGAGLMTLSSTGLTLTVDGPSEVLTNGVLYLAGSTVNGAGGLANRSGTITMVQGTWATQLHNESVLEINQNVTVSGTLTTSATSLIRVEGTPTNGAILTVSNGFTNYGEIELTEESTGNFANLVVSTGTLVNEIGGLIEIVTGAGRIMTAEIDNRGTLLLGRPLLINATDATHTNSGTIDLSSATLTLTQTAGTGSFTNESGGQILLGFNLNVNDGTLALTGGTVTGPVPSRISMTNGTLDYVSSSLPDRLTLNNVTVTGGLSIPVGESLTLEASTFDSDVDVQGTLTVIGVGTLGGALTTSGTLDVHGTSGTEAQLTVTNAWTNTGTIQLTGGGSVGSRLTITEGTLVNDVSGIITTVPGGGITRVLTANVDNYGVFNVNQSLTQTGFITQWGATSLLAVPVGQALTLDGSIAIYPNHQTIVDGTLDATLGCIDLGGIAITGTGQYPGCFPP